MTRWQPFGADHVAALGLITSLTVGLVVAVRRRPAAIWIRGTRVGLAVILLTLLLGELWLAVRGGWFVLAVLLPLQLCDLAVLLAVAALISLRRVLLDLLYFWAFSGTLMATITPDLARGFPSLDFVVFFGLHGLVLVSVALLTFGLGLVPARGAWWRAFLITAAYAGAVGVLNLVLKMNFLYLCHKPTGPTLLDYMGPWPVYVLTGAALALGLFYVLDLPLRRLRRGEPTKAF